MEKNQPIPEAEIISMQVEKKFRAMTKKFLSSKTLSAEVKAEVLEKTTALVQDIYQASQKNIPFEEVLQQKTQALQKSGDVVVFSPPSAQERQSPDLSEVPCWRGSKQDGSALDFLQTHYGHHLSAFGAADNTIYQDDIWKHDPKLLSAVRNKLNYGGEHKLSDFVLPRVERTKRELETLDPSNLKKTRRIEGLLKRQRVKNGGRPQNGSARNS